MSIEPVTWNEAYGALKQMGYRHPNAVKTQMEKVRQGFSDLEPFVAQLPSGEVLFLAKGTLLPRSQNGAPPVIFVITLQHPFPNSYPILTVEEPPAPWRFANHPHVDTSGQTYLGTVSGWNPANGQIMTSCLELRDSLAAAFPFENKQTASAPPPPVAQPLNHQPQRQPQPVPVQQQHPAQQPQVQRQQHQHQQQNYGGRQPARSQEEEALRAVARTTVSLATVSMGLLSTACGGGGASRPQQDRTGWEPPKSRQLNQQQARQEQMKQDFLLLMQGKITVPPGTEINTPAGFGPNAFMTSRTSIDGGLLTPGQAPMPGAPCTDPTPEEHHKKALEQQKLQQDREAAAASQQKQSTGWKALSAVGRLAGKAATSAKNKVEEKVRDSSYDNDQKKFQAEFPEDAANETLIIQYSCNALSGDGQSRHGHVFISHQKIFFSGVFPATPSADGAYTQDQAFKFCLPFAKMVSTMKAECVGKKMIHCFMDDGTFRTFLDFKSSTAASVGAWVSVSMSAQGDSYDRCWNWLDHTWRKAAPVPSPTYVYYGQSGPLGQPQQQQQTAQQPAQQPLQTGLYNAPAPQSRDVPATAGGAAVTTPATAKEEPPVPTAAEGKECNVCMEAQKNAFFQPCGHVCCCMNCANKVDCCPICRSKIMQVFPAFV